MPRLTTMTLAMRELEMRSRHLTMRSLIPMEVTTLRTGCGTQTKEKMRYIKHQSVRRPRHVLMKP